MGWLFDPLKPCAYTVILADPPTRWESFTPFESAKGPDYATMSPAWLRSLPVGHLAAGDCLLWLWSTMPQLQLSLGLLEAWGFRYVTGGSWIKRTIHGRVAFGTGQVLQSGAEVYLIGARGRPPYVRRPVPGVIETLEESDAALAGMLPTVLEAQRREHSRKPDEQYAIIDTLMGDVPRCELFARTCWPGWEAWGDQIGKFG